MISRVARQLGVGVESLRIWVKQAEVDAGRGPGLTTVEHDELVKAAQGGQGAAPSQRILQAAATFFGAELDRRQRSSRLHRRPPGPLTPVGVDGGSSRSARQLAGRPLHLLRRQGPPALARALRDADLGAEAGGVLGAQLLGLRTAQALEGRPAGRHGRRAGPGGPPHAPPGHPGRHPGEEALHHQVRPRQPRAPDLVKRDFTADRPDAFWVADFTYCSTWSGIVYVAFIIDVFSRRLVGWKVARSMSAALVLDALNMAAWTRRTPRLDGLVCHTDAGSQYTSIAYTERLTDVGAAPRSAPSATVSITPWPNR